MRQSRYVSSCSEYDEHQTALHIAYHSYIRPWCDRLRAQKFKESTRYSSFPSMPFKRSLLCRYKDPSQERQQPSSIILYIYIYHSFPIVSWKKDRTRSPSTKMKHCVLQGKTMLRSFFYSFSLLPSKRIFSIRTENEQRMSKHKIMRYWICFPCRQKNSVVLFRHNNASGSLRIHSAVGVNNII